MMGTGEWINGDFNEVLLVLAPQINPAPSGFIVLLRRLPVKWGPPKQCFCLLGERAVMVSIIVPRETN